MAPPGESSPAIHDDLMLEMLEVCTHNVLYMRRVYPVGIFQKRRLYNCTVYRSRFPPLNEYIANALRAAQFLHRAGKLHKYELVLSAASDCAGYGGDAAKIESYFFDMTPVNGAAAASAANGPVVGGRRTTRADNAHADLERLGRFEEKMRTMLLALDAKCKNLRTLPDRVAFSVKLHTTMVGQSMLTDDVKLQVSWSWRGEAAADHWLISYYLQDFPWICQEDDKRRAAWNIVPLAFVVGIQIYAENYG